MIANVLAASKEIAEIASKEPVMTWNLFLTLFLVPVSVSALGIYMRWMLHKRDMKDEQIELLKSKLIEEKEKSSDEWRQNHQEVLCRVKQTLDALLKNLQQKVGKDDCIREHDSTWKAIEELRNKI